ncbi:hypothetical protein SUDANB105_00369 [Streptomyces sp. enrichment culture]|uniref:cytosine permease n=1 Tax=Streptomyces sp. enrichment culture TaxID=1795815 RepID=UPI003F548059
MERIPDADLTATPSDLFRLAFGGANTFSTCVLGAFPILFGLSFLQGLAATLLGVITGALILCPMALFGPVIGTNNAVSSSAHLGVHGRVVDSFLSLLTAVAFFSLSVWSSGDALVGGAHRLFGVERGNLSYAVAYALFAGLVLAVCVYGFRFAWWVAAAVGVLFTNIPGQFVGPLGGLAGGVDIGLPLSLAVAAVLFLTLLWLFPEPRAVYGPEGARLVRTAEVPVPPVTGADAGGEVPDRTARVG